MFIGFVLKQFEYIEVGQFRYGIGKEPLNIEGLQLSCSERQISDVLQVGIRFAGYFCLMRKGEFPSGQYARLFSGSNILGYIGAYIWLSDIRFHVTEEVRK